MGWALWLSEATVLSYLALYGVVYGLAKGLGHKPSQVLLQYFNRAAHGINHMIRSSEAKGKPQDADLIRLAPNKKTKLVVFVRHGESVWNQVFNRGFNIGMLQRWAVAVLQEIQRMVYGDSLFFDTPLSAEGIRQASVLVGELEAMKSTGDEVTDRIVRILKGESEENVCFATSNLRRAIQTAVATMRLRAERAKKDKLFIISAAQEMSRNIDTQSWLGEKEIPKYDLGLKTFAAAEDLFDARYNFGNKSIASKGLQRQLDFCRWAFQLDQEVVVVFGHSLWFKSFFKNFLPQFNQHESKKHKIVNCGVVAFELSEGSYKGQKLYLVDDKKIKVVYGGFAKKK
jgi:broad specificity phosphatase PhoE